MGGLRGAAVAGANCTPTIGSDSIATRKQDEQSAMRGGPLTDSLAPVSQNEVHFPGSDAPRFALEGTFPIDLFRQMQDRGYFRPLQEITIGQVAFRPKYETEAIDAAKKKILESLSPEDRKRYEKELAEYNEAMLRYRVNTDPHLAVMRYGPPPEIPKMPELVAQVEKHAERLYQKARNSVLSKLDPREREHFLNDEREYRIGHRFGSDLPAAAMINMEPFSLNVETQLMKEIGARIREQIGHYRVTTTQAHEPTPAPVFPIVLGGSPEPIRLPSAYRIEMGRCGCGGNAGCRSCGGSGTAMQLVPIWTETKPKPPLTPEKLEFTSGPCGCGGLQGCKSCGGTGVNNLIMKPSVALEIRELIKIPPIAA